MKAGLGGWLFTVLTVSLFCALGEALMAPGPVKQVGKLVCGLALLCGVLGPLSGFKTDWPGQRAPAWEMETLSREELEEQLSEAMRRGIEQRCAAYIQDKAMERGFICKVRISCRAENGTWLPDSAVVTGSLTPAERGAAAALLTDGLNIPAQRQRYVTEEEEA